MTTSEIILFIVQILAGTGVFLVGVRLLTVNIEQLATAKIKSLFNKTANKKLVNVGIGTVTTAIIQSSGVTTVLIVGFVNVGIMNLTQATAMIMGANIGTTITAQIAALSAFDFAKYITLLAFIGIMMAMLCSNEKVKKSGLIIAGLGLVFIGLSLMSSSMSQHKDSIQGIFETVKNPFLLAFAGIILTALVQSSSATTSVIIAMSAAGLVIGSGGNEVLYIILGTNIGSCVTAIISTIGANANAKRAGLIHLMFNVFGSVIFFIVLTCWPTFMQTTFSVWFPTPATQVAMFHTFFNLICTIIFLPFTSVFVKVSEWLIKDKPTKKAETFLDDRILTSPSLALSQVDKEMMMLADTAMNAFKTSYKAFCDADASQIEKVLNGIEESYTISQNITNYLIKLSPNCNIDQETIVSSMHDNLGDIMRIAEIADNFIKYTRKEIDKNLVFSAAVKQDLDVMVNTIDDLFACTKATILNRDPSLLPTVDELEKQVDSMKKTLVNNHVERLNKGTCHAESSSIFINLVSNIERLGDHLTYIAHSVK